MTVSIFAPVALALLLFVPTLLDLSRRHPAQPNPMRDAGNRLR
jgi:hypothetical protein